jgi:hypothetical protein
MLAFKNVFEELRSEAGINRIRILLQYPAASQAARIVVSSGKPFPCSL